MSNKSAKEGVAGLQRLAQCNLLTRKSRHSVKKLFASVTVNSRGWEMNAGSEHKFPSRGERVALGRNKGES